MGFLGKLLLWQKLLVIGLLAAILSLVPLGLYLNESNKALDVVQMELRGITPSQTLLHLVQLMQQQRGLSLALLSGNDPALTASLQSRQQALAQSHEEVQATLGQMLKQQSVPAEIDRQWQQFRQDWQALSGKLQQKAISGEQSFALHTASIHQVLLMGDALGDYFGLSLDPEVDSYYLVVAGLTQLPALTEELGRLRARGALLLGQQQVSPQEKARLGDLLERVGEREQALKVSLEKSLQANPALRMRLEPDLKRLLAATMQARQLAQQQIMDASTPGHDPERYRTQVTGAIDQLYAFDRVAMKELDWVLQARLSQMQKSKYGLLAGFALLALCGIGFAWMVVASITQPLLKAVALAKRVAQGDLSSAADSSAIDEVGQLLHALHDMNQSLLHIVSQVRSGTDLISSASHQVASGNADLAGRTQNQASSLEQTAAATEQLLSTVKQNGENAQVANGLAHSASEVARRGGQVVAQVVDTMGSINDSSKKIVDIISVIDGIAFQTNILALNAAVEAARAGEQGRGFAVVATEVRNLAQRSAAAAREIKGLIVDSVQKVEQGGHLVDQAGHTMQEIVQSVARVTDIMSEISSASAEQVLGIEQINQAIAQMDDMTQQNAALVEQASASASAMQQQAGALVQLVSVFRAEAKPVLHLASAAHGIAVRQPAGQPRRVA
jgi:methyl-accepting chemotaxis protein